MGLARYERTADRRLPSRLQGAVGVAVVAAMLSAINGIQQLGEHRRERWGGINVAVGRKAGGSRERGPVPYGLAGTREALGR